MKLYFDDGRVIWLGKRHNGGIAVQQGRNRLLLSADELPTFLEAVATLTKLSAST